jgi:hypothetical protein
MDVCEEGEVEVLSLASLCKKKITQSPSLAVSGVEENIFHGKAENIYLRFLDT